MWKGFQQCLESIFWYLHTLCMCLFRLFNSSTMLYFLNLINYVTEVPYILFWKSPTGKVDPTHFMSDFIQHLKFLLTEENIIKHQAVMGYSTLIISGCTCKLLLHKWSNLLRKNLWVFGTGLLIHFLKIKVSMKRQSPKQLHWQQYTRYIFEIAMWDT